MSVPLEPPLTRGGAYGYQDKVALTEGPRYARTSRMGRWHRIRSGTRHGALRDGRKVLVPAREVWHLWCGQTATSLRAILCDVLPDDGAPVCGTCEGRALGAGHDPGAVTVEGRTLRFDPLRLTPPTRCPGSHDYRLMQDINHRVGRCLVCQELMPIRNLGSPYNPTVGLTNHPPGPGLVPGCPFHAWRELIPTDDGSRARCACQTEEGDTP